MKTRQNIEVEIDGKKITIPKDTLGKRVAVSRYYGEDCYVMDFPNVGLVRIPKEQIIIE